MCSAAVVFLQAIPSLPTWSKQGGQAAAGSTWARRDSPCSASELKPCSRWASRRCSWPAMTSSNGPSSADTSAAGTSSSCWGPAWEASPAPPAAATTCGAAGRCSVVRPSAGWAAADRGEADGPRHMNGDGGCGVSCAADAACCCLTGAGDPAWLLCLFLAVRLPLSGCDGCCCCAASCRSRSPLCRRLVRLPDGWLAPPAAPLLCGGAAADARAASQPRCWMAGAMAGCTARQSAGGRPCTIPSTSCASPAW